MYIVEGNMGAGKTTFLRLVAQHLPEIKTIFEPVNNWQHNVYGQSLLANFYESPYRWAYTFELFTLLCRIQDHLQEQQSESSIKIIERSIYSGYYCFARNSYAQGFMNDMEWYLYEKWFSSLIPHKCIPPRGFIYMRISPEIAYERIKMRNRLEEKTLSFTYLQQIHKRHESFLIKKEGILPHLKRVPVLILNCNEDFEQNTSQLHKHLHAIESFLTQTGSIVTPYKYKHNHQKIITM
jgi:deoxyadenosine/deoxycytidine kinase